MTYKVGQVFRTKNTESRQFSFPPKYFQPYYIELLKVEQRPPETVTLIYLEWKCYVYGRHMQQKQIKTVNELYLENSCELEVMKTWKNLIKLEEGKKND